jgi:hypothetical protein
MYVLFGAAIGSVDGQVEQYHYPIPLYSGAIGRDAEFKCLESKRPRQTGQLSLCARVSEWRPWGRD